MQDLELCKQDWNAILNRQSTSSLQQKMGHLSSRASVFLQKHSLKNTKQHELETVCESDLLNYRNKCHLY